MLDKYKRYKDIGILYIATRKGVSFKMKAMFNINDKDRLSKCKQHFNDMGMIIYHIHIKRSPTLITRFILFIERLLF